MVEAAGFEPASCHTSLTISTWLVRCSRTTNKAIRIIGVRVAYNHQRYWIENLLSLFELSKSTQLGKKACVAPAAKLQLLN